MPAKRSSSSEQPAAVAPDGIAIHIFDLPPAQLVGIAEGRIGPGRYSIHRHLTVEQYTYVVEGSLLAETQDFEQEASRTVELQTGDLLLTLPYESLQFINESEEPARVLFICAPPYPPDDSDTRLIDSHAPPSRREIEDAIERLAALRRQIDQQLETRMSELRNELQTAGGE
jgi:mannose-6-phosphate isomerase-like protein (cupin superfamily)